MVAYYVSEEEEFEVSDIRASLSKTLPDYMIPSFFVKLDSIPSTSNGKVDRRALPDPEIEVGENYIAPSNEIEEKLVSIWSEVLNVDKEKISVNANFFDLGGNSLLVIELVKKIEYVISRKISIQQIFTYPTISDITRINIDLRKNYKEKLNSSNKINADYLRKHLSKKILFENQKLITSIKSNQVVDTCEVGAYQRNYLRNNKKRSISVDIELNTTDEDRVRYTVIEMVKKHDVFRCILTRDKDKYYLQKYANKINCKQNIIDLTSYDSELSDIIVDNISMFIRKQVREIGLLNNILFNMVVVKKREGKFRLLLVIHHIISDMKSISILKNYFNKAFRNSESDLGCNGSFLEFIRTVNIQCKKEDNLKKLKNNYEYISYKRAVEDFRITYPYNSDIYLSEPLVLELYNSPDIFYNYHVISLYVVIRVCMTLFNVEEIPIRILTNRRIVKRKSYVSTLGLMHDNIMLCFNKNELDINTFYKRIINLDDYISNHLYHVYSYGEIDSEVHEIINNGPIYYNFLNENENSNFSKMKSLFVKDYKQFRINGTYSGKDNKLTIIFRNGINKRCLDSLINMLEEEIQCKCKYYFKRGVLSRDY
ncbi:MAG: hypothetical protein GQ534_06770 [Candidatus Delongbacteria bacterium]|nr:hypothetical protein [Candidatus Delongbacteria bacterium]